MIRGTFILFLCLTATASYAQRNAKSQAKKDIETLKEGVLLIKLYDYQSKIDKLIENGYEKRARAFQRESDSINKVIVEAFTKHYSFSSFGFYLTSHEKEIKADDFSNVYFLNGVDTISKYSEIYILDSRNVFFESMGSNQLGFSILDKTYNLVNDPFPYYVRKREAIFFLRRNHYEMTIKLQKNLDKFWDKSRAY